MQDNVIYNKFTLCKIRQNFFYTSLEHNDFQWMKAGDGAQYLPGGEVERVTT